MAIGGPQSITYTGVNITFAAPAGLDAVGADSRGFMWVKNPTGASRTVTIAVPGTTFEQNNPDVVVTIPAGEERMIGPLDPALVSPPSAIVFVPSATDINTAHVVLPTPPPGLP